MVINMNIYLYGTGSGAENLYLNKLKGEVYIKGFIDSDENKWGKKVAFAPDYKIEGADAIAQPYDFVLIASVYSEIVELLLGKGIPMEKICVLNEYTNNEILNISTKKRYTMLKKVLKPQFLQEVAEVENLFPLGNYSSPIVDIAYVKSNENVIFRKELPVKSGINLNVEHQIALLQQFCKRGEILPFKNEKQDSLRYFGDNDMFPIENAHILSQIIIQNKPRRIIEVGSGFSSAVMLDINEKFFNGKMELSFIEPYAQRLKSILNKEDRIELKEKKLQEIDLEYFEKLEENDILFIDSSHVSKTGSDVNYIVFEILPILKSGVIIHFHDIFYPFEYPQEWVYQGRGWNESYILRAFLQYNNTFEIYFWENSIRESHILEENERREWLEGGCLYIRKR